MATADEIVTIAHYETVVQADLARGILEENGIRTVLADAALATTQPFWGFATGGVSLQVLRPDAARAVEILRAHEAAVRDAGEDGKPAGDEADGGCIACGAAIPEYLDRCPACGWSYS
jgi:hypothetical protein